MLAGSQAYAGRTRSAAEAKMNRRGSNSPSGERTNIMANVYRTLIVMISLLAAVARAAEPSAEAPQPEEMARLASLDRPAGMPMPLEFRAVGGQP
jgi:hypothetical protein